MNSVDEEMIELKNRCVPLIFDCPRKVCSKMCPFEKIRKKDVVNRVNWLKSLSAKELRSVLGCHDRCVKMVDAASEHGCITSRNSA